MGSFDSALKLTVFPSQAAFVVEDGAKPIVDCAKMLSPSKKEKKTVSSNKDKALEVRTPRTNTQILDLINLKQFIVGDIELCNKDIGI